MADRRALGQLAREPLYNTRAVVQITHVPADTFRAWERRYGVPRPHRTPGNQRLYSERDIGVIGWLRDRTDEGMTISQAIKRLRIEHPELFTAESVPAAPVVVEPAAPSAQVAALQARYITAALTFDEQVGDRVIDEALALFTIEDACARVFDPMMVDIGERWARNELSVASEHFASNLLTRRLSSIFNLVLPPAGRGTVIAACSPGEEHEIGLLILSILLARRNLRVIYLGANVPVNDLVLTARGVSVDAICLSAALASTAEQALAAARRLLAEVRPIPGIALGGRAFSAQHSLRIEAGAHIVTGHMQQVAEQVVEIVESHRLRRGALAR